VSLTSARVTPVSAFRIFTVAPAMMAPVESVTTPLIEASPCAQAEPGVVKRSNKNNPAIVFQIPLVMLSPAI
jgi:hypothetical protein